MTEPDLNTQQQQQQQQQQLLLLFCCRRHRRCRRRCYFTFLHRFATLCFAQFTMLRCVLPCLSVFR